ncbi:uncharacterized protein ASPGLDRAFT_397515 [Aspergillus glaucus CBS 516.65]|uniref:Transmembrane protein n=1 Tax=Aspergillus glaucus CBS 516.65 TaxID=1160497 RepID=A0A1L9VHK2_ASPGL|nr:hypothetical protein ASPGLDRAFT_397515 [Aspergillus glaucus CBS 516.65]OJJ83408.1 hypothetical protein ASPGLDRAFT_397515 [Aspergillus glaucus CBS 516.65]
MQGDRMVLLYVQPTKPESRAGKVIFVLLTFFFYPIFSSLLYHFILIICSRLFVRFYDFASCLSLRFLFAFIFPQVVEIQLSPYSKLRYDAHSTSRLPLIFFFFFYFVSCLVMGGGFLKIRFRSPGMLCWQSLQVRCLLQRYAGPQNCSFFLSTTIEIRIFVLLNILRPRLLLFLSFSFLFFF